MRRQDRHLQMIAIAIERVLDQLRDRAMIGSIADLRRMYEDELAANRAEIEAQANMFAARAREMHAEVLGRTLRCVVCNGAMPDAKRPSRRYCSPRCRQRAQR